MVTGLGVQNHAYGGASAADPEALPGENFYGRARHVGQFFVSGTIGLQISDYLERTLRDGKIERADTTAFLIWAGANDYISKEPLRGTITTFLNSPEGEAGYKAVVERAVTQLGQHVRSLYAAGARRLVMMNLPDLGRTPRRCRRLRRSARTGPRRPARGGRLAKALSGTRPRRRCLPRLRSRDSRASCSARCAPDRGCI